jgi:FkbM family methyltransferase
LASELRPLRDWTVALHPAGTDFVSDGTASTGYFERHVMARISSALGGPVWPPSDSDSGEGRPENPKKVFVDIGANIGFHTLFALALGHDVISFEPFGRNVALIRASVAANEGFAERLWLHKRALTDSDGIGALCILSTEQSVNQGNARVVVLREPPTQDELAAGACAGRWVRNGEGETWAEHDSGAGILGAGASQVGERVESARLDSLVALSTNVHAVKADIEGYEALALRGAAALLDAHAPCTIVFEYNNCNVIRQSGVDCNALIRDLALRGYRLFELGSADDITPPALGPDDPPTVKRADGGVSERKWGEYEMRLVTPEARERCASVLVPRRWESGEKIVSNNKR